MFQRMVRPSYREREEGEMERKNVARNDGSGFHAVRPACLVAVHLHDVAYPITAAGSVLLL